MKIAVAVVLLAARPPWGDVQNNKWGDCHPGLSREMARKMLLAFGA